MVDRTTLRPETKAWGLANHKLQGLTSRLQSLTLWGILILAGILRFYCLGCSSLWSDEGNTWALLSRSFVQIAHDAAADIHPPGYYWLLKVWTTVFGASVIGMRSFSATVGVMLVWLVYLITVHIANGVSSGGRLSPGDDPFLIPNHRSIALLAALLAAVNPFQVYYSQEARMYMLLALESAGLFWALARLMQKLPPPRLFAPPTWPEIVFVACGVAGLWTHYSFPIVLAAAGLACLIQVAKKPQDWRPLSHRLLRFATLNLLILLAFVPWLPTALERVQAWPKGGASIAWQQALQMTAQTLLLGPLHPPLPGQATWLALAAILPLLGLAALFVCQNRQGRFAGGLLIVALWLLAPIALMLAFGLYNDAFLKFLLIASPPWCIAIACTPILLKDWSASRKRGWQQWATTIAATTLATGALLLAWWTLSVYFAGPSSRDNYAGAARFLAALGDPERDLVILDAPGQQEVWQYYDPGLPVLAAPLQRPPDATQTITALTAASDGRRHLYALFWATDEADPDQIVERWLDQNAFKGVESWLGNLRFVVYSLPGDLDCRPLTPPLSFADGIALLETCQSPPGRPMRGGDVFLAGLQWQALAPISQRYKVTLQLLDAGNQVIAQHDGEPGGGSQPTDNWAPGQTIRDNHGLALPLGTPPGVYRLIVALYDRDSGQRLSTGQGDAFELGQVTVASPHNALPVDILPLQHRVGRMLGPVRLLGYTMHRKGFDHAPASPVQPGDLVHFTFYWQAPEPRPAGWPEDLRFTLRLGNETLQAALAGGIYPTGNWRPGEIVRGEFDLRYDGLANRPQLTAGGESYRLVHVPAP